MVSATKGYDELVTDPASERARLGKSQVVRVGRPASAQQARLRGYEIQVRAIAIAAGFAVCEDAFIDMPGHGVVHTFI
jgi:hypothetical protein